MDQALIHRVCKGNPEAIDFLSQWWAPYVHAIDDIIDGDRASAEDILKTFAMAAGLYSHPFYLRNFQGLRQVVLNITNEYADAVAWEKSKVAWQRDWADHHRHAGMGMVIAVATICGGFEHARAISLEQRAICYAEHREWTDREVEPVPAPGPVELNGHGRNGH